MNRPRGAVFEPVDDYHGMNFYPHEKTRPGAPAAKHGTETGNPTTNNEQKGNIMSTGDSPRTPPPAFTPQWNPNPTPEDPNRQTLGWAEGPAFHEHSLNLVALWHPDRGVKIHLGGSHEVDPQINVDDLPRLAAAMLRFYDEVRGATRESTQRP